jgi:hypothetical protein
MRKTMAVIALLLLPAAAMAQRGRGGRMRPDSAMQNNVVEVVLQHKTDLSLNSDQVSKLEAIGKKLEEANKPIAEELRKQQGAGRARDLTEEQRTALRATMEKVRENRTKALDEMKAVLNEEQMAKVRELVRPAGRRGGR